MLEEKADRYNEGKLRYNLLDWKAIEELVRVLEFGAKKYAPDNWKKGLPYTDCANSLMRHYVAWINGEDVDKETNLNHLAHIMCNAMFLLHYHQNDRKDLDDRCITQK